MIKRLSAYAAWWLILGASALATTQPVKTVKTTKHTAVHKTVKHVPVVAPRHPPPKRAAVAAAKKAVVKHEAPAPTKVTAAKPAPPPVPADVGTNTGLHLPRYASLKSDDVNMRVGPAERYPVIWTYQRRDLPVRIEREFDIWRLVEDMDGVKGWVHQATLTGRRTFVTIGTADTTLRAEAQRYVGPGGGAEAGRGGADQGVRCGAGVVPGAGGRVSRVGAEECGLGD